jgi:hypothetical protein
MFEEIIDIIHSDVKCQNIDDINSDIRNTLIPTIPPHIIQNIICDMTKQSKMNECNRVCYSYDKMLKSFVQHNEEPVCCDINLSPLVIEYFDDMMFLEMIHIDELAQYLHINSECDYVALPVLYGFHAENKEIKNATSAHISVIIFDNINKFVYYLDSNGWDNTENFKNIENFIEQNISMLEAFGANYCYLKCEIWNKEQIYLNINYNHNELKNEGNCMTWMFLIIKLLQETKKCPGDIFDELEKLDYESKVYVIKSYGDILLNLYASSMIEKYKNNISSLQY